MPLETELVINLNSLISAQATVYFYLDRLVLAPLPGNAFTTYIGDLGERRRKAFDYGFESPI